MAKGDIWQITSEYAVAVRTGPDTSYKCEDSLHKGDTIVEIATKHDKGNLWIQHSKGWSMYMTHSGATYMKKIEVYFDDDKVTTTTQNSPPPSSSTTNNSSNNNSSNSSNSGYLGTTTPNYSYDDSKGAGYQPGVEDMLAYTNSNISNSEFVKIKNVAGVFGLPYQFLPTADVRLSGDINSENIGYEYADKIITRMPLIFLTPGKASFMTKYSKKNRQTALEWLLTLGVSDRSGSLEDLLTTDGKYYTFEYDRTRYYKYVNPMCRIAARYLEIQDLELNGTKLDRLDWGAYTDGGIKSILSINADYGGVPFYVDADTSISENFSNSTTQSMIASAVNSVSDMGRELNFLFGYSTSAAGIDALNDADVQSNIENINNMIGSLLGSGSFLSNLSKHLVTVTSGGKLVFPEIWNDSTFSRSYNVELKLSSPDPSKFSVYLNVLVPLFHLLGLVAPHTDTDNPNGYVNPFLIRAVYKGFFNIDMGIITDMSITKGAECQWTPEGIPTSITVNLSIKDLYSAMSITSTESLDWKYDTLNNTALMDYIANLCGINIFAPEIGRMIDMWFVNNFTNRVNDLFAVDIWKGIQDKAQSIIMNIYR